MKRIDIFVPQENVPEVTMILHKHDCGGISLTEIKGRGKIPHESIPEVVTGEWHMTGRRFVPEYVSRTQITTVASDSQVLPIVQDLRKDVKAKRGKLFVSDIIQAFDLASGSEGEAAL